MSKKNQRLMEEECFNAKSARRLFEEQSETSLAQILEKIKKLSSTPPGLTRYCVYERLSIEVIEKLKELGFKVVDSCSTTISHPDDPKHIISW